MSTASPLCDDKELVDDKLPTGILEQVPSVDPTLGVPESAIRPSPVWWKLDLLVLPIVFMVPFFACLDAANIGNARIAGLQQNLGISDEQFTVALMVALIPDIVIQIPAIYLMTVVGPHILLPIWMILLGVCSALQGVVTTYSGFLACRFFSGLFLGPIGPGSAVYLAGFYPRRKLQLRMSVVYAAISLAPSISSLLAAGIGRMDGLLHKAGYQWLFILDGAASVVLGFVCLLIMPKSPASVFFLTEPERQSVTRAMAEDSVTTATSEHDRLWYTLRRALAQPHILLNALAGFLMDVVFTGLIYFLPSVIVGLGFEGTKAQLLSVPPFVIGAAFSLLTSLVSDRYGCRGLTTAFCAAVAAAGFAAYIASGQNSVRYMSLILAVTGSCCVIPSLITWSSNNTALPLRRAISIAWSTTLVHCGGILSVWLFGTLSAPPRYTSATITLLAFEVGIMLCAALGLVYLRAENKRKQLAREAYMLEHGERPSLGGLVPYDSIWFEYVM